MAKIIPGLLVALIAVAMPSLAMAQGAGVDAYQENPPTATGDNSGSSGSQSADPAATPGSDAAPSDAPQSDASGFPTEAQAAAAETPDGELPATGLETLFLALAGLGFVASGLALRSMSTRGSPQGG